MAPHITAMLMMFLGIGTSITFASSNWILAWVGLEINTLAILPLMTQRFHPRAIEAAVKYFLVQEAAAATILYSAALNAWLTGEWAILETSHPAVTHMCTIGLALKIGLAPLHAWLPEVLQGLELSTGLIVATWQKLAPFILLTQVGTYTPCLLTFLGLVSIMVGGWGGLNQTQLRKILAYSSVAHLGWMALMLKFFPSLTLLTLIIYIIMTMSLFLLFSLNNTKTIGGLAISWNKTMTLTTLIPFLLFSLAGLPPLTGFMPKWFILHELTKQNLPLLATVAALSALMSAYFYLRLAYAMTMTTPPGLTTNKTPWRRHNPVRSLPLALSAAVTILALPLAPALMALMSPSSW
uniref:NADH-ubiquinone oxidoreductase chain 2 n=1 Tax=Pictichromis paccagnellae TaxID=586861 RepID=A0A0U3UT78_9TELE|nr:NADH dehydrogenase subunit 2 [Pictichromis paccagnellae]ALV90031.1 NADH dehydrogenase subunit 2 [Pictichromis paccagnellae]